VEVPAGLLGHLNDLADSIGIDAEFLHAPLTRLVDDLLAAVPSYRGLRLTIVQTGQPVTLTDLPPAESDGEVLTSLRIPLGLMDREHDGASRVILYARTPGAFVDLAADLGYALKTKLVQASLDGTASHPLLLDADLPPASRISGLTGIAELAAVNRAIGLMIGRGHRREGAYDTLRREATEAGVEVHIYAARMLGR
jgi:hypothetical protein